MNHVPALKEGSATVFPIGAVKGSPGLNRAEMAELYKVMWYSQTMEIDNEVDVMRRAFEHAKIRLPIIVVHEEDMEQSNGGVMNEGSVH